MSFSLILTAECNSFISSSSSSHVIYNSLVSIRNVILADCVGYLDFCDSCCIHENNKHRSVYHLSTQACRAYLCIDYIFFRFRCVMYFQLKNKADKMNTNGKNWYGIQNHGGNNSCHGLRERLKPWRCVNVMLNIFPWYIMRFRGEHMLSF